MFGTGCLLSCSTWCETNLSKVEADHGRDPVDILKNEHLIFGCDGLVLLSFILSYKKTFQSQRKVIRTTVFQEVFSSG